MLSIGGDDLAKLTFFSPFFNIGGDDFCKIDLYAYVQFFAQNKVKTKTKVITFADAQFWDMKILGGIHPSMDLQPWL